MGAGRPKTIEDPVKFAFWIERRVFERAAKLAAKKGIPVSEFFRESFTRLVAGKSGRGEN